MPLIVRCKNCGNIVKQINDPDLLAKFDAWSLEGKKCQKCGHVFHVKTAEYKITPLLEQKPLLKRNRKMKIYTMNNKFWSLMKRRHRCQYCDEELKVGDKIVSIGAGGKGTKRYHLECYKKYQAQEIIVRPFRKVAKIR